MVKSAHIIIVTHNSEVVLSSCLSFLEVQKSEIGSCTIVDSGSDDRNYLYSTGSSLDLKIIECDNVGFSTANNIGYNSLVVAEDDVVLFINPDTFLPENFLKNAKNVILRDDTVGVVSGKLLGYDPVNHVETKLIDSTGIFRKWYGRWFDRGQGEKDNGQYNRSDMVPALCGALLCCRASCLHSLGAKVFDESFFLYKEDIELSLRIRKQGWKLCYEPSLVAFHCRGWNSRRSDVDYRLRLRSAENEIRLYWRHPSVYIVWAAVKYLLVRIFRV